MVGEGGNGFVYKIIKDNTEFAIKVLSSKKVERFEREIKITKKYHDLGLISIICDGKIYIDESLYWYYVMPYMTQLNHVEAKTVFEIKELIRELILILSRLSDIGVYHRDIKPGNIVYDTELNKPYFIDLGLGLDTNEISTLTRESDRIGSLSFIAPERIKGSNSIVNNEKADVYSLGMTIWSYFAKSKEGFSGQYDRNNQKICLKNMGYSFPGISIVDDILERATSLDPKARPTFSDLLEMINSLNSKDLRLKDFHSNSSNQLKVNTPDLSFWFDSESIVSILKGVNSGKYNLELLLFDGGWVSVGDISLSENYKNFLVIDTDIVGCPFLLAPKLLLFYNDLDMPFYILELNKIKKMVKQYEYDEESEDYIQSVVEISVNNFTYQKCSFYNDYNGTDISDCNCYNIVNEGRFLLRLSSDLTSYSDFEFEWEETLSKIDQSPQLYNYIYEDSVLGEKFKFHEIKSTNSRNVLFSDAEENYILNLIEFIDHRFSDEKSICMLEIKEYSEYNKNEKFHYLLLYLVDQDFNDHRLFPLYFPLDKIREYMSDEQIHMLNDPHYYIRKKNLIQKLYRILYKYAKDNSKY